MTGSKVGGKGDFRTFLPRFAGEQRAKNDEVVERLRAFAAERGMTPGQLAIAWVRAREPDFLPVIGARTVSQLTDALGAVAEGMALSAEDLARVEAIAPTGAIAGSRYGAEGMRGLDSER